MVSKGLGICSYVVCTCCRCDWSGVCIYLHTHVCITYGLRVMDVHMPRCVLPGHHTRFSHF